ncbi:unnamed protein product [Parnassius apollo]|uniref:(apollo) hypothetical protein n=1 Tax=Parnassius apollo TaxID=110799 RepID=A0A8S3X0H3_PARAO|nr:unnamed protein product [Parnassius apollo]
MGFINDWPNNIVEPEESKLVPISEEIDFDKIVECSDEGNKTIEDLSQEPHFELINHSVQIHNTPEDQNIDLPKSQSVQIISVQCNPSLTASMNMKNLTPVKLKDILILPKTPIRKGVKNSVKTPFVLTSAQWKAQESEEIRIKEEKSEGIKKRKEERERKKIKNEKRPVPKKQKNKTNDEISKILFSEKFYKFDSEDTIVQNKENDQELIDILDREHRGGSIGNRTYTTAEIEKNLTELDN